MAKAKVVPAADLTTEPVKDEITEAINTYVSEQTPKPVNKLVLLRQQEAEIFLELKKEFAEGLAKLADTLEGLKEGEVLEIVSEPALEPSLQRLGLKVAQRGWTPPQDAPKARKAPIAATPTTSVEGVTGSVLKKVSDKMVMDVIGEEECGQKTLVEKWGQLVPKRLAEMEKAGLLKSRKDGIKNMWSVVKKG